MTELILAIDQGTTSSRAILFDKQGNKHHVAQQEFTQYFPQDGWVEHDPEELWDSVQQCVQQVIRAAEGCTSSVIGIGITNQRETTLLWDRATGKAVYPAIVWQDRRTSDLCDQLKTAGYEAIVTAKTGLLLDPYFSATKLAWILDHNPELRGRAERGELAFGTVDSFLIWRLTNGKSHASDATNASRTMLFNIHTQQWDADLLALFNIPEQVLPRVLDSAANFGQADEGVTGLNVPIAGVAGDQQAALIGQACFQKGMAKSTYGTGCFLVLNTGDQALVSDNKLLTTVAYRLNGKTCYALEGSIFIAGAAVQWLRDGLKIIDDAADTEALAKQRPLNHGVYLVPAFTGLGAPYWDAKARGGLFGLNRDTGIAEIASAGLQSVCYQTRDLILAMARDGQHPNTLRVDGGMANNGWLMQFLADMLNLDVQVPTNVETTALGAAYLAGLQLGVYASLDEISGQWQRKFAYQSVMTDELRSELYSGWEEAVKRVISKP